MRIIYTVFLLSFVSLNLAGQSPRLINGQLNKQPFSELVKLIEDQTDYKIYFLSNWVDTLHLTAIFQNTEVPAALQAALLHTSLQFYIDTDRIIITQNAPILTGMVKNFFNHAAVDSSQFNYNFLREFVPGDQKSADKKKMIIEIGIKQATVSNKLTNLIGYIRDRVTGEPITGAYVYVLKPNKGTTTNTFGYYSLSLSPGPYTVISQYAGMKQTIQDILLYSDGKLDMVMEEDVISLKEVTIESDREANITSMQMGTNSIDMKSVKNIPKILGENDILKVATALPGVKTVGEGSAGINVRGGSADQNLMMINEAPIYNTSHFLGFFSVFNADVIKTSELYKSGIPAQYGGRLASIFDIGMKDGNQKKFSGHGGISPVMTRLTLELPVIKDKASLLIGGRTTYSDWVLQSIPGSSIKNSNASFYDLSARYSHTLNEKNSLFLTGYFSKDKFKLSSDSVFSYSNALASLQWRHQFSNTFHSLLSITHSEYKYNIDYQKIIQNAFDLGFQIKESNFKLDFTQHLGMHKLDYGVQSKLYGLNPGYINKASPLSYVSPVNIPSEQGLESALYLADNIDISPVFSIYAGLRFSSFQALGPRSIYHYQAGVPKDNSTITDTVSYRGGSVIKTYQGPEYRIALRYALSAASSVKINYNRTRQYIHMLSNTVSVSPTNTWKLSDPNVMPQIGDQIAAGYYKNYRNNTIEASVEVYYKWLQNVIDYKIGAEILLNKNIEKDILQGKGKAYGIEFLLRKRSGIFNGWVSYTYSRTFLRMNSPYNTEKVNGGNYYPANYDKPHDFSFVGNYKITRRYSFSMNFVYNTGRPITYPSGVYYFGGGYKVNYSDRNQYRIPDYIRMDLGFNIEGNHKIKKLSHSFWSISIYNLLGRRNPYSVYFVSHDGKIQGYKLSIFGAPIPTVSYNFKF